VYSEGERGMLKADEGIMNAEVRRGLMLKAAVGIMMAEEEHSYRTT
jgi:hypothetical protein